MERLAFSKNIQVTGAGWHLGCDPEVFLSRKGVKNRHIVGSERVLGMGPFNKLDKAVTDGVQVELHPAPTGCRANLSGEIQRSFVQLNEKMKAIKVAGVFKDLQVDFSTQVTVSKAELLRLSEKSRVLGCTPSQNAYGVAPFEPKGLTGIRSGAGHIHIGCQKPPDPISLAKLCDILVGIPCVLIDRDPNSAKRRKRYGRAGEFRTPPHGFEYRTLSNFWLRHYVVYSLVFGMTKFASMVEYTARHGKTGSLYAAYDTDLKEKLIKAVDPKMVQKAINENDFDLAYDIFDHVCRPVFENVLTYYGLDRETIPYWDDFVAKGLDHFFPNDNVKILQHWMTKPDGHGTGWETFTTKGQLTKNVRRGAKAPTPVVVDPITNRAI